MIKTPLEGVALKLQTQNKTKKWLLHNNDVHGKQGIWYML